MKTVIRTEESIEYDFVLEYISHTASKYEPGDEVKSPAKDSFKTIHFRGVAHVVAVKTKSSQYGSGVIKNTLVYVKQFCPVEEFKPTVTIYHAPTLWPARRRKAKHDKKR